jgi:uncharacterized protein (TIGR03435 family)
MKPVFGLWMALASIASAQSFEVASIKLHQGLVTVSGGGIHGATFSQTAVTLRDLIQGAYDLRTDQISGGPSWMESDRYDIAAKGEGEVPIAKGQLPKMLQALLSDRFQLKVHRETRETPVFELVVGKNGSKLTEVAVDATGGSMTRGLNTGVMHTETAKGTMEDLARQISLTAGRPVIDKTGLKGFYKYTLDWLSANQPPDPNLAIPSIFTAVQEQLGLKLESVKAPVEMLIVDHAEKPSEN